MKFKVCMSYQFIHSIILNPDYILAQLIFAKNYSILPYIIIVGTHHTVETGPFGGTSFIKSSA